MKFNKAQKILMSSSLTVFLAGCGAPNYSPSETHITVEEVDSERPEKPASIPSLVKSSPGSTAFSNSSNSDTYDVVVTNVPVRDLLFALARDSEINMDVDDEVGGLVTMSALDQTLDAILVRIGEQIPIRVETIGEAIVVKADTPYTKIYRVDFLNITRDYSSSTSSEGVGSGSSSVSSTATSDFWTGLEASIESILETEYSLPEVRGAVASLVQDSEQDVVNAERLEGVATSEQRPEEVGIGSSYNLNPETGVLSIYASSRVQKLIQELLDSVLSIAKRQVLLEATVVEVVLNNQYSQGIDWSLFNSLAESGLSLYQGGAVGGAAAALSFLTDEFEQSFIGIANTRDGALADANRRSGAPSPYDRTIEETQEIEQTNEYDPELDPGRNLPVLTVGDGVSQADVNTRNALIANLADNPNTPTAQNPFSNRNEYTATVERTVERYNEEATKRQAGGLRPNTPAGGLFQAAYRQGDLSAAVSLLDSFGDARVLSSPRISALNHQPALLRVVDQEVYFNLEVTEEVNENTGQATSRTYEVTENTVDIGFAMNILPQISGDGEVILNLKPSVTRVLDYRNGISPSAFGADGGTSQVQNLVPITRVRELESVISLRDGEVAVLGGLLEDRTGDNNRSVPGISKLPGIGALFSKRDESTYKTEFVVFIRARIIKNPSINGDYSDYRSLLPDTDFIIRDTEGTFLPPKQRN